MEEEGKKEAIRIMDEPGEKPKEAGLMEYRG